MNLEVDSASPDQSLSEHYAVVVIGAGPTGLTIANLLGRYGVRTLVVERNKTTVGEPRAVSIDDESLRTMQATGIIDAVLDQVVEGYGSEYLSPNGRCFLRVQSNQSPNGYARRNAFQQPNLEAQLRHGLARFPQVETLWGVKFNTFRQKRGDAVKVELCDQEHKPIHLTCDFLVGADGASSTVRTQLGVTLKGHSFAERWLIVDLKNSPAPSRETLVFCDPTRPCIALPGPNQTRRFEFKLRPAELDEEVLSSHRVLELLASRGAHPDSTLVRKVVYTFQARVAQRWSNGQVFLAGDACHLTPPFAGQGMNSGIRDAHNLAWKLAAVVQRRLGHALLHSYEEERRAHVQQMIQLALTMGRIMGPRNHLQAALTRATFTALSAWPAAKDYFAQMKYRPKPRFKRGFLALGMASSDITLAGQLVPQPIVLTEKGERCLLDDVLGDGFAFVGINVLPDMMLSATTPFEALGATCINVLPKSTDFSHAPGVVQVLDVEDALSTSLKRQRGRVLLVRPDRYVVGSFPVSKAHVFSRALKKLLERTNGIDSNGSGGHFNARYLAHSEDL